MARFLAQATHGREDPERATLPFIVANVAASADQDERDEHHASA